MNHGAHQSQLEDARENISFILRLHYFTRLLTRIINTCSHLANIFHIFTRHPIYTPHPFPSFAIPRHSRHVFGYTTVVSALGNAERWKIVRSISFRFVLHFRLLSRYPFACAFHLPRPVARNNLGGSQYSAGILIKLASFNYSAIDSRAI